MKSTKQGPTTDRLIAWQLNLVKQVMKAYLRLRFLPELVAQNLDDTPGARSSRWTVNSCHYVIDIQHALRDALKDQPDKKELIAAWVRMLADDRTIRETESRLIGLLAPILQSRKLDPGLALRTIRRKRTEMRGTTWQPDSGIKWRTA